MSELSIEERGEIPVIEVRVFRHGALVHRELCESEEQAALVVDDWAELDGVVCEVDDLTVRHGPDDILAPEPAELDEDDYPVQVEVDSRLRQD
jgi:hypothetical protein